MRNNLKWIVSVLSLVVLLSGFAIAQRTTGDVEGTVKDPKGAVVPGVDVTLTGINVGFNRTVQSDANGLYRFPQVPAGNYKITSAAKSGFAAGNIASITVTQEETTTADLNLGLTASVNTVDVTSDPMGVNVDTTDSKVQTNITAALIDQLPKGNNFSSLLRIAPGVRAEPLSGGFQVDGASGSENSFNIDGQALENFRTGTLNQNNNIPQNMVQEVQIKTSGFEAEHGGASGGVISVVTKGGSDQWRGEFGQQFELSKFQSRAQAPQSLFQNLGTDPQFLYTIRQPKDSYANWFPTMSLGGPIVKGRAWFYGNYSPQIFDLQRRTTFYNSLTASSFATTTTNARPDVATGVNLVQSTSFPPATYSAKTRNEYAFARIDASIFSNLRYSGTFLWNPTILEGAIPYGIVAIGGTPDNARVYNGRTYRDEDFQLLRGGRSPSNNFTSQLIYTPTSKLVLQGRYGRAYLNEKQGSYATPTGPRFVCSGVAGAVAYTTNIAGCPRGFDTGLNAVVERDISLRNEWNVDAAYSVGDWGGRHEFKGGFQYGTTLNDVNSSFSGTTPINDPFWGVTTFQYGRNFSDAYGVSGIDQFCNLKTTANPNGNCLGIGRFYRFGTLGKASNKYIGLFIQDKWQPTSRLTLNLGVRDEKENLPAFNTGTGQQGVPLEFGFDKKIAPRLGFAYDLFGDGKTRIWGSYGRFFDRLKFALPRGSFGGDFFRRDYFPILTTHPEYSYYTRARILGNFTDPIGGGNPSLSGGLSVFQADFRIPSNITEAQAKALGLPFAGIDPDLKPFRQDELTFGIERELSRSYVFSARYTRKNVASATEDHGILGANASENYIISNPGEGKALELDKAAGYSKSLKPQRLYNGLEIAINKRLSHNYFFNVNYTLSRLYGNYSGLASSDEGGRTDPGVSRYFDYIVNGFTLNGTPDNGLLPTDRTHALKAYGGYTFDWMGSRTHSTDFSFFQQILQGTPQTTYVGIEATDMVFDHRGDLGRTPVFTQTDFSMSHRYKFGRDKRFSLAIDLNILNLFNEANVLLVCATECRYTQANAVAFSDIDPTYTNNPVKALNMILNGQFTPAKFDALLTDPGNPRSKLYGLPTSLQGPRNVRFGMRFFF